jgi:predicted DNA-binding protein with PD1-like motif
VIARALPALIVGVIVVAAGSDARAQQAPQPAPPLAPTPEGYVPRGYHTGKGMAPGMMVTDLGKGGRTYRVTMTKGDEIISGLTDFAEKYHIRHAHLTGLGAIGKGLFGWTDVERRVGQKKIEINQEAEIVSMVGSISPDRDGTTMVHVHGSVALQDGSVKGGHWHEAHVSIIAEIYVTEEEAAPGAGQ